MTKRTNHKPTFSSLQEFCGSQLRLCSTGIIFALVLMISLLASSTISSPPPLVRTDAGISTQDALLSDSPFEDPDSDSPDEDEASEPSDLSIVNPDPVITDEDESPVLPDVDHSAELPERILLDVPVIKQLPELITGCEATAVTMMLNYAGIPLSKHEVAVLIPSSTGDPNQGYVGDPYSTEGWTVYPPALTGLLEDTLGSSVDLTGSDLDTLRAKLVEGKPIVCWIDLHGLIVHAVTVTGYDSNYFYYNDPWTGEKNASLRIDDFWDTWKELGQRALSY